MEVPCCTRLRSDNWRLGDSLALAKGDGGLGRLGSCTHGDRLRADHAAHQSVRLWDRYLLQQRLRLCGSVHTRRRFHRQEPRRRLQAGRPRIGKGPRCAGNSKTKPIWTDWSHIMANQVITPSPEGATGRIYLLQMESKGQAASSRMAVTKTFTRKDGAGLAHSITDARAGQSVAQSASADTRSELAFEAVHQGKRKMGRQLHMSRSAQTETI